MKMVNQKMGNWSFFPGETLGNIGNSHQKTVMNYNVSPPQGENVDHFGIVAPHGWTIIDVAERSYVLSR